MRFLLVVGVSVASAAGAAAQINGSPYGGGNAPYAPNYYNRNSQPLSPYLNLLRGGNPAVNYFYGVRPGLMNGAVASPLAMLMFLKWWLDCRATRLTITRKRVTLKRGILSRRLNEVRVADIRNVRVDQSALQRLFGVGSVGVSSSGQGDVEIEVHGIPAPHRVREVLDDLRG